MLWWLEKRMEDRLSRPSNPYCVTSRVKSQKLPPLYIQWLRNDGFLHTVLVKTRFNRSCESMVNKTMVELAPSSTVSSLLLSWMILTRLSILQTAHTFPQYRYPYRKIVYCPDNWLVVLLNNFCHTL